MSTQPEALRLADRLDQWGDQGDLLEAAAELRRLHAEVEALTKRVAAYKLLDRSQAEQLSHLRSQQAAYREAADTLQSERAANALLTAEVEALRAGQNWSLLEATQESLREHMAEINRLRGLLEQAEQAQPVAWAYPEGLEALKAGTPWTVYGSDGNGPNSDGVERIPLYLNDAVAPRAEPRESESGAGFESLSASPNADQAQPVAWIVYTQDGKSVFVTDNPAEFKEQHWRALPLYTVPPQRKPLTDEQVDELDRTMVKGDKSVNWLCQAIEAAHGIKEKNT